MHPNGKWRTINFGDAQAALTRAILSFKLGLNLRIVSRQILLSFTAAPEQRGAVWPAALASMLFDRSSS